MRGVDPERQDVGRAASMLRPVAGSNDCVAAAAITRDRVHRAARSPDRSCATGSAGRSRSAGDGSCRTARGVPREDPSPDRSSRPVARRVADA